MTEEMANQVRRLLKELGISQNEMAKILNETCGYKVSKGEMSYALNGLNSPKCVKIRTDSLAYLTKEKMRQQALLDLAKGL